MSSPYRQFIATLTDSDILRIVEGELSIGCGDQGYGLIKGEVIAFKGPLPVGQARGRLLEMELELLEKWFLQRPLCRVEFDYQALGLLTQMGAERFCRHAKHRDNWALMIDDWRLVAVGPEDVRSQYGYFCEVSREISEEVAASKVMDWLRSGEAYEDYRSKTHCRYCM